MLLPLLKLGPQRNKQMFSIFNLWVLRLTWSKWVGNPDFFGPKMSKIWNKKDMCPLFVVPSVICNYLQPQIKTISQIIPFQPPSLQNRCAEEELVSESRLWSTRQVQETMLLRNQREQQVPWMITFLAEAQLHEGICMLDLLNLGGKNICHKWRRPGDKSEGV